MSSGTRQERVSKWLSKQLTSWARQARSYLFGPPTMYLHPDTLRDLNLRLNQMEIQETLDEDIGNKREAETESLQTSTRSSHWKVKV